MTTPSVGWDGRNIVIELWQEYDPIYPDDTTMPRDSVSAAPHANPRADAGALKIEITPVMIEAGASALRRQNFDLVEPFESRQIAQTVFEAMVVARPKSAHAKA